MDCFFCCCFFVCFSGGKEGLVCCEFFWRSCGPGRDGSVGARAGGASKRERCRGLRATHRRVRDDGADGATTPTTRRANSRTRSARPRGADAPRDSSPGCYGTLAHCSLTRRRAREVWTAAGDCEGDWRREKKKGGGLPPSFSLARAANRRIRGSGLTRQADGDDARLGVLRIAVDGAGLDRLERDEAALKLAVRHSAPHGRARHSLGPAPRLLLLLLLVEGPGRPRAAAAHKRRDGRRRGEARGPSRSLRRGARVLHHLEGRGALSLSPSAFRLDTPMGGWCWVGRGRRFAIGGGAGLRTALLCVWRRTVGEGGARIWRSQSEPSLSPSPLLPFVLLARLSGPRNTPRAGTTGHKEPNSVTTHAPSPPAAADLTFSLSTTGAKSGTPSRRRSPRHRSSPVAPPSHHPDARKRISFWWALRRVVRQSSRPIRSRAAYKLLAHHPTGLCTFWSAPAPAARSLRASVAPRLRPCGASSSSSSPATTLG